MSTAIPILIRDFRFLSTMHSSGNHRYTNHSQLIDHEG